MTKFFTIIFSVIFQIVAAFTSSQAADNKPATVRISMWVPVVYLDPVYSTTADQVIVFEGLFEGLINDVGKKTVPAEASSWDISDDGKRYAFTLRDDIVWSDGMPVIARDYVTAFRRIVDPSLNKEPRPSYLISMIKNADKIEQGEASPETLGVSAPNDKTVVFELENPASFFLEVLKYPGLTPVPSHLIEKFGDDWWKQRPMVSNGPYQLANQYENGNIMLKKNSRIAAAQAPDFISFEFMESTEQALRKVMTGKLDIAYNLRGSDLKWLKNRVGVQQLEMIMPGTVYATFNTTREKLADPRVREALALSIDRAAIAKATDTQQARTFASPWMLNTGDQQLHNDYSGFSQQERLKKARALLAQAGFGPDNPLELKIMTVRRQNLDKAALAMRSMFARIGVKAEIEAVPQKMHSPNLAAKNYEVSVADWIADYNDAMTYYSILKTGASKNHSAFSDREFDRLLDAAMLETDTAKRRKIYARMENILQDKVPVFPLTHLSYIAVALPTLESIGQNFFSSIAIQEIRYGNPGE